MRKQKAFTLAEILITLGVIGIVAAMTIPGLINNYQKKQTVMRLKETYSIIQQAIRLSQEEYGEIEAWDTTLNGHDFFHRYIADYVKWMNEYSSTELKQTVQRKLLDGNNYTGTTYNANYSYHFTLINGSMVSMNLNGINESGLWVGIDVNGLAKPNMIGRDTFLFFFSSEYGLRPLGDQGTPSSWHFTGNKYSRSTVKGSNYLACAEKKSGYWCSALIVNDGWTIAGDYPWN